MEQKIKGEITMKKINVLKICYWCLLFTSGFMLATVFPKWTFKPIIIMLCALGAGYIDRMIDEEKNNYGNN